MGWKFLDVMFFGAGLGYFASKIDEDMIKCFLWRTSLCYGLELGSLEVVAYIARN